MKRVMCHQSGELSLNEMEQVQGGWSFIKNKPWKGCAANAKKVHKLASIGSSVGGTHYHGCNTRG